MTRTGTMSRIVPAAAARSRTMMMAVVLGTALSAAGSSAQAASVVSTRAVEDISRYCQACWRNARLPADRWGDCTQEVLARLLRTVDLQQWSHVLTDDDSPERKEFVRAIDAVKKRTQRARKVGPLAVDFADYRGRNEQTVRDQREAVALAGQTLLSPRQRRILELSADGWPVPEIADELKTTPERVSDEKYKAIRKLRHHFGTA